ncbi:VOC family protein [Sphingosinicella sp. BN140058]|uniref:VOC family protein n=1 Tax=Sphingosinicella sp. BN140058 TaxID=1892855 RepID=UPI00101267AF|nr:VOC family protein [Sphingosinicella sp. BN140058]QAY76565.1 VOC family protein [Sphingosinicella sp. BN140058]
MLRVSRPTDRLDAIVAFYQAAGLRILGGFEDHEGFDGVMLGHPGAAWHLEFSRCQGYPAGRAPTQDNLLILYLPERRAWEAAVAAMRMAGHAPIASFNPYWDRDGVTFEDPDGYRLVFQNAAWPATPAQADAK